MKNVIDVWNDLKEHFAQEALVYILELEQEIYALKQDNRSVTELFTHLKILWEELEMCMSIPNCSCRIRCSCNVMKTDRRNHNLL